MNRRLAHECAFALAKELTAMIAHNYRDEELRDIFEEFYKACKEGMEAYGMRDDQMQDRLKPFRN